LGSEAFIEKHASGKKDIKEIPRAQLRAAKPSLDQIFGRRGGRAIGEAYEQGYRLNEIAARLGVHYATVSRRLKRIEQTSLNITATFSIESAPEKMELTVDRRKLAAQAAK